MTFPERTSAFPRSRVETNRLVVCVHLFVLLKNTLPHLQLLVFHLVRKNDHIFSAHSQHQETRAVVSTQQPNASPTGGKD